MTRTVRRRPGFTLVELMVVIALIAVISAVTIGAVFRVRTEQNKSFTEATLTKLDQKLNQKLKPIIERVRDPRNHQTTHYKTALSMAGGNTDIAQAILIYAYTKQELPMTFAEANPAGLYAVNWTLNGSTLQLQKSPIFAGLSGGTGSPEESAVCIYLALSTLGNEGLEQQIGDVPSMPGQKCYLDAYGQPIVFNRFAVGGDANIELDNPPFVKAGTAFDPYFVKLLPGGSYRALNDTPTNGGYGANANLLWAAAIPPNATWAQIPAAYQGNRNHVSTLISGGANKSLDVPTIYSADNIVSYRLRKEGQGGD